MKKINPKILYKIVFRVLVTVLIITAIALVPTIYFSINSPITNKFSGNVSNYKGILELWNIDSFEGGTGSKKSFLTARSVDFESTHKGLYVMVKNMTEAECLLALEDGQRPTMFSFGVGVGSELIKYLSELVDVDTNLVKNEFLSAGKSNGNYAVAWCRGTYSLITTPNIAEEYSISSIGQSATVCGKIKQLKYNKTKTIYSLTFGGNSYNSPQMAYSSVYGNLCHSQTSFSEDYKSKTAYNAYCDFVEGKANILLGTQRDVARISNRISQGKLDGAIYEHLTSFTDLVQFIGVCNNVNYDQKQACEAFISYLVSEQVQLKLANIGMQTVCNLSKDLYTSGEFMVIEQACKNSCVVQNVFTTKEQLKHNANNCVNVGL